MIKVPDLQELGWLVHGFGLRDSAYGPLQVRMAKQIHSNRVLDAADCTAAMPEGDALISRESGVVVGVKTADCVPILLVDPVTRAVAAVHAGWRGTVENIAGAAVRALGERWGVVPRNILAAIGPSIGPCCYEVGPEVGIRFGISGPGKTHLDLPGRNSEQLREAGVNRIWLSGECTYCEPDRFFSVRREREQAGRMVSFIGQGVSADRHFDI
jgi:YfiH family protein